MIKINQWLPVELTPATTAIDGTITPLAPGDWTSSTVDLADPTGKATIGLPTSKIGGMARCEIAENVLNVEGDWLAVLQVLLTNGKTLPCDSVKIKVVGKWR